MTHIDTFPVDPERPMRTGEAGPVRTTEAIYREVSPELLRFAVGLVGTFEAQDAVSTAVAKTLRAKPDWARLENPRAYLFRAVYNASMSMHRRSRLRSTRSASEEMEDLVDDHSTRVDLSLEVLALLDCLSIRQRAVVTLTYWDDLKPREIANLLDISEGTVKKHLARARARLRKEIETNGN